MTPIKGWASRLQARPCWPLLRRLAGWLYLCLVLAMVLALALRLDWPLVLDSLQAVAPLTLVVVALLSLANHLAYSAFDLLGRSYTGHQLSAMRVLAITFVSYIGTLNFGAFVGAIAMRQRLYAQAGVSLVATAQIFALSVATNWLGYGLLLGGVLAGPAYIELFSELSASTAAPWPEPVWARLAGGLMFATVGVYVAACGRYQGAQVGRLHFRLPGISLAIRQVLISSLSWLLNTLILYVVFGGVIRFDVLLLVSLTAAVAGLLAHIPASIGVLEGVFVLFLGSQMPAETLVARLLLYRTMFYLLPLPIAGVLWWRLESASGVSSRR